jgi:hypothetical protein
VCSRRTCRQPRSAARCWWSSDDGGPQYVRMDTGLTDIHVGDSVWAAGGLAEGLGRLSAGVSPTPIYVGMIEDLYNYDDTAAPGDTGVLVVLKHAQPVIA